MRGRVRGASVFRILIRMDDKYQDKMGLCIDQRSYDKYGDESLYRAFSTTYPAHSLLLLMLFAATRLEVPIFSSLLFSFLFLISFFVSAIISSPAKIQLE